MHQLRSGDDAELSDVTEEVEERHAIAGIVQVEIGSEEDQLLGIDRTPERLKRGGPIGYQRIRLYIKEFAAKLPKMKA